MGRCLGRDKNSSQMHAKQPTNLARDRVDVSHVFHCSLFQFSCRMDVISLHLIFNPSFMPPPRSPLPISVPPPFVLSFCFTIGLPHARHPHTGRRQIKGTKATHCMFRHTFQSGFLSILYSLGYYRGRGGRRLSNSHHPSCT